ncbi:HvfA family oxazolone/thioamide-modified RiPP metallophore [Pseudomonas silesiensis]
MSRISNNARFGLIAIALAGGLNLASSAAFAAEALPQGYQLASAVKAGEGKCGEGKCGAEETGAKATTAEGKCGEGKCGDASFARTDTDDDSLVSRKEFLAVAPTRGADFEVIDADHDGFLSEAETYKYMKNVYESNGKEAPTELFSRLAKARG